MYRKLLHRVERMVESARLKPFGEAYARCRAEFEALLHHRLSDLQTALTGLVHLVADVDRRDTLLENVLSRRGREVQR